MWERLSDLLHADPTVTPAAHVPDGEQGHGSLFYVVQAVRPLDAWRSAVREPG